jgi:hypothetical protein
VSEGRGAAQSLMFIAEPCVQTWPWIIGAGLCGTAGGNDVLDRELGLYL